MIEKLEMDLEGNPIIGRNDIAMFKKINELCYAVNELQNQCQKLQLSLERKNDVEIAN